MDVVGQQFHRVLMHEAFIKYSKKNGFSLFYLVCLSYFCLVLILQAMQQYLTSNGDKLESMFRESAGSMKPR